MGEQVVLGPGAKGDPDNPEAVAEATVTAEATVAQIKEAVRSGELSTADAMTAEQDRDGGARSTLMNWLEDQEAPEG